VACKDSIIVKGTKPLRQLPKKSNLPRKKIETFTLIRSTYPIKSQKIKKKRTLNPAMTGNEELRVKEKKENALEGEKISFNRPSRAWRSSI